MKRWMKTVLTIGLCLFLVNTSAAAAMKRGDKGESVMKAQLYLIDLGYLNDDADGVFGKKTEAAVKAFQKTIGAKQTGKLTTSQEDELMFLWMDITGVMEGDGLGEDELREMYPAGCCPTEKDTEYCWRHFELGKMYERLHLPNLPDKAVLLLGERMLPLYEEAINALYEEWETENPDVAQEQYEKYEEELEQHRASVEQVYGVDTAMTMKEMSYYFDLTCVNLCFDLHTAEANTDE